MDSHYSLLSLQTTSQYDYRNCNQSFFSFGFCSQQVTQATTEERGKMLKPWLDWHCREVKQTPWRRQKGCWHEWEEVRTPSAHELFCVVEAALLSHHLHVLTIKYLENILPGVFFIKSQFCPFSPHDHFGHRTSGRFSSILIFNFVTFLQHFFSQNED